MTEPIQDKPERAAHPESDNPPVPKEPEASINEDLLDLRENLERDHRLTRQTNFALISLYLLVSSTLVAGAWMLWQYLHRY